MIATILAALAGLSLQAAPAPPPAGGWVWTLYEGDSPIVLAYEVPDTPRLQTTLECDPGSGAARLALYGVSGPGGFGEARAGTATAAVEARAARGGRLEAGLRTDHPVFAAFAAGGELTLSVGGRDHSVTLSRRDLAKLRRFSELCGG